MFYRVKSSKLYEEVIKQIVDKIAQGVYKKGDMLPSEKTLMDTTGVSRATVREALKALAEVGIIKTQKGKGSFVIIDSSDNEVYQKFSASFSDFKSNFEYSNQIRLMIEPEIAKIVAMKINEDELNKLKNILEREQELLKNKRDATGIMDQFHRTLFEIVDNPVLLNIFEQLINLENTPTKVRMNKPENHKIQTEKIHNGHTKIYKAIKDRNSEFAYFYMKENIMEVISAYNHYFEYYFFGKR